MATFRVGQKARFVKRHPMSHGTVPVGSEVTVTHVDTMGQYKDGSLHKCDYLVVHQGYLFACNSDQLEPLYDGYQKTSWDAMKDIWAPDRYYEKA